MLRRSARRCGVHRCACTDKNDGATLGTHDASSAGFAEPFRPLSSRLPFSAGFCISSCPGNVVFVMPTKKRKDMPGLHWEANEIALDFVAIGLAQEIELLGAFDAFCDDADL